MNITKLGSYLISSILLLNLLAVFYAGGGGVATTSIHSAVCDLVVIVRTVMGAVMLLLIILAAAIYAAGQVMGAETRARANVWATSMFVGAIIGGLIYLIVPILIDTLTGVDPVNQCGGPGGGGGS